jgi:hypothetical protein
VAAADPEAAIGRVYDFWRKVRQQWLGTRYFCWLELQARGAVHYHCVWLNPPHVKRVNLIAWVQHAWGTDRTQVRFSDGRRGLKAEIDYALGYAKKMGNKRYQQLYDNVPRQLRTFMSQRLEIPPEKCDPCIEKDVWAYRGPELVRSGNGSGLTEIGTEHLELVGRTVHVVLPGGRCVALDHRRPRAGPTLRRHPGRRA